MHPMAARSNRSSLHHSCSSPIPTPSISSSVYHQQQQQQQQPQQILYAPISNPMVTYQPCGTVLHSSCVYPSVQPHNIGSPNSIPLHLQGKNNRWHSRNKQSSRSQQYYQQQQQLSYNPKPLVLFDQPTGNVGPIPPSTASLLVATSTFTHSPLTGEHCGNTGGVPMHLLPQSYFKPPDGLHQTFCLIQDRQNTQQPQQQQQNHPLQASYYNISATNTCSLQTVNANTAFPLTNLTPYSGLATFASNQLPSTSAQTSAFFSGPPVGLVFAAATHDKPLPLSATTLEFSSFKHNTGKISSVCESRVVQSLDDEDPNDWSSQLETFTKNSYDAAANNKNLESANCSLRKVSTAVAKTDEEHYSDESSTSFDFTIEAEKMVSALCNTTSSNDLGKEESKPGKTEFAPLLFNGAGDNISNKNTWFADYCPAYENGTSVGVQTDDGVDRSQYPELIRKTAYWGCTEAEIVLEDSRADWKRDWLTHLSSATRTAITKSTTCIPVFAGDWVFADDLISALLRVSNGWLTLDNYLNKQHFPNLLDRLEPEFIECFHVWEESTCELLKQIACAFRKFSENRGVTSDAEQRRKETYGRPSSFPGDVSLYTTCNLFAPAFMNFSERDAIGKDSSSRECAHGASSASSTNGLRELQCNFGQQEEQQSANHKESKLRSRWTITGNLSSLINSTRSVPDVTACRTTDVNSLADNKLHTRDTSSSCRRLDSTRKSLNAEFYQLRSKVMKSNVDTRKDRKRDYASENKHLAFADNTESIRSQNPTMSTPVSYRGLYTQNSTSLSFPLPSQSNSSYPAPNSGILPYEGSSYSSSTPYPATTDHSINGSKDLEPMHGIKGANTNPVYVGGSQADQIELPTVPRNKVTLLSQIEPRTFDKESEEMAANLSAWFASMRNAQLPTSPSTFAEARIHETAVPRLSFTQQETSRYSTGVTCKQAQLDANRQYQALQNLPNIQSTPWAAAGTFAANRSQMRYTPDEYDSSEDVRVYMKPGSYNVPKKRHQRRPNRRAENNATSRNLHAANRQHNVCSNRTKSASIPASSTPLSHMNTCLTMNIGNATLIKTSFPPASQLPAPQFDLETISTRESPERVESQSQDARRDVTWKAACASAEILLEALNIKDYADTSQKVDRDDDVVEEDGKNEDNAEVLPVTLQQSYPKSTKRDDADCASSYEASEDGSGTITCRLSPSTSVVSASQSGENENALSLKTNVKTDFWLIRTLNNASIVGKQKRLCKDDDVDQPSSESSNSSVIADVKTVDHLASSVSIADVDAKIPDATTIDIEYPAIFPLSRDSAPGSFSKNDNMLVKESKIRAGRATYSETVRRSVRSDNVGRKEAYKSSATDLSMNNNAAAIIPSRKWQKKDPEQPYQLLHKLQKSAGKRVTKNVNGNDLQIEEGSCAKVSSGKSNDATPKSSTKTHSKAKNLGHSERKGASKSADRGWSVWYSSRRKQCLSPLTFSKLEAIHRTVWQMDEADILKCPLSRDDKNNRSPPAGTIGDYRKFVKSPIFLEVVNYKMKNRAYYKIEHAVKDFRRIIHDAKSHHQHDDERAKKIEVLSKKLEELLQEHFGNWELDNINTSVREDSPIQPRFKIFGQKSIATRCDSTTKKVSPLVIAENSSLH